MAGQTQGQKIRLSTGETVDWNELVKRVAKRVWELWREDLRREHERRGAQRRS